MDYELTQDELLIKRICEAGRMALLAEEVRRYEADLEPLTDLQKEIIYQRYRDKAADLFPHIYWNDMYDLYDRLYKEVEEEHMYDSILYA